MAKASNKVAWSSLNKRQQDYLQAIYQADQEVEKEERATWSHGGRPRPANVWRWMPYATSYPGQMTLPVKRYLSYCKINEGTGSTLEALERRGLIKVKHYSAETLRQLEIISEHMGILEPDPIPTIQITPTGRKLVRQALDIKPAQRLPRGGLQEWHWRAMARAYQDCDQGVPREGVNYGRIGWNTWLRLKQYMIASHETPLVEEREHAHSEWHIHLTPLGLAFYERSHVRYRALYPEVEAPAPTQAVAADAPYIEHTQKRRWCLACRGAYLAHLTWTYQQHADGTWSRDELEARCSAHENEEEEDACRCQAEDLQEHRYSFLAFLDEMQARGWLVQCSERHTWYNYLPYLFSRQGNIEYVEPRQVKVVIAPLVVGNTDIEDYRNVALLAEGLYVESARVGAGTYYAILGGKVNYLPLIRTKRP